MNNHGNGDFALSLFLLTMLLFSLFWGSIVFQKKGYNADCTGIFEITVKETAKE